MTPYSVAISWSGVRGAYPSMCCMSPRTRMVGGAPAVRWRSEPPISKTWMRRSSSVIRDGEAPGGGGSAGTVGSGRDAALGAEAAGAIGAA